ncbi:MAG: hypothetical protein Q4B28_05890 [bacterium]|nr:hypothetical protein [bacterium]
MGVVSAVGSDVGGAELGVSLSGVSDAVCCIGFASGRDIVVSSPLASPSVLIVFAGFPVSGAVTCVSAVCSGSCEGVIRFFH